MKPDRPDLRVLKQAWREILTDPFAAEAFEGLAKDGIHLRKVPCRPNTVTGWIASVPALPMRRAKMSGSKFSRGRFRAVIRELSSLAVQLEDPSSRAEIKAQHLEPHLRRKIRIQPGVLFDMGEVAKLKVRRPINLESFAFTGATSYTFLTRPFPKAAEYLRKYIRDLEALLRWRWASTLRNPRLAKIAEIRWWVAGHSRSGRPHDSESLILLEAAFRAVKSSEKFEMNVDDLKDLDRREVEARRKLYKRVPRA